MKTNTRRVAQAVILVAIGVALGPIISIPIGPTKIFPAQHFVNVLGAVLLGPGWAVAIAAIIGIIRNSFGVGTLFAFPGGVIGALLAGYVYRYARNIYLAALGEIVGTGIIAALVSWWVIVPALPTEKTGGMTVIGLVIAFSGSTIAGSVIGVLALKLLERVGYVELGRRPATGD